MTGVALIGAGMVADTWLAALQGLPDLRLTGVLARTTGADFLARHEVTARVYDSVAEIAADPDADFVALVTPPDARQRMVEVLTAAKKPILMEKPVERSLAAARALVQTCEAAGVPLGIALQQRLRPSVRALRDRLDGLGPLRAAEIRVPWWRPQSYYDQPGRGTRARDGGGVMISQAIHTMDLALQFTGPVADVVALTATTGLHRMETEDFVSAGLRLASGAPVSLFATTAAFPGRAEEIVLNFATATARLAGTALTLDHLDGSSETLGEATATGSGADPMAFGAGPHRAVLADFAEALGQGRPPAITGRSALPVHALIEAIETAGRTGQRTRVEQSSR